MADGEPNPYAAPTATAPAGRASAIVHLYVNVALQAVMLLIHALTLLVIALSAASVLPAGTSPVHASAGQGALMAALLVWTGANVAGLVGRRPWARSSTMIYWSLALTTCVLVPVSVYALLTLGRSDAVWALFSENSERSAST